MLTIYLRKEPTRDCGEREFRAPGNERDVVAYRDPDATDRLARWPWYMASKPDKRNRWRTINCYRYRVQWLPDLEKEQAQ